MCSLMFFSDVIAKTFVISDENMTVSRRLTTSADKYSELSRGMEDHAMLRTVHESNRREINLRTKNEQKGVHVCREQVQSAKIRKDKISCHS